QVHLKDLQSRLGRFAERFPLALAKVTATQIHDFLLSLDLEPRTRNNFRTCISNLVNFARQRRYVPRDFNPLTDVPVAKEVRKPVEIFTVEEMTTFLTQVKPEIIPFLCLVAFGGLRHEEATKLPETSRDLHCRRDYHFPDSSETGNHPISLLGCFWRI